MARTRIRLIHWNPREGGELVERLRREGFDVEAGPVTLAALRALNREPPAALVVDLTRSPSRGRDVAVLLRRQKGTRAVPLIFLGGGRDKVRPIRKLLPDARYGAWERAASVVGGALATRPARSQIVPAAMAGYSGTPLARKLGVKTGSLVRLVGAPAAFEEVLGEVPEGVRVVRRAVASPDLTLWFVRSARELASGLARAMPPAGAGLWILWPKRGSGLASDISEREVREAGLAAGLVDFKICAVDETWSGLRFAWRASERRHAPRA